MEQKLRFGLLLGHLAVLKKYWLNYEYCLGFHGQNLFLDFSIKTLRDLCIMTLHTLITLGFHMAHNLHHTNLTVNKYR